MVKISGVHTLGTELHTYARAKKILPGLPPPWPNGTRAPDFRPYVASCVDCARVGVADRKAFSTHPRPYAKRTTFRKGRTYDTMGGATVYRCPRCVNIRRDARLTAKVQEKKLAHAEQMKRRKALRIKRASKGVNNWAKHNYEFAVGQARVKQAKTLKARTTPK